MVYGFPLIATDSNVVESLCAGIKVTAKGPTGHGSQFIPNTAVSKLVRLVTVTHTSVRPLISRMV